VKRLVLFVLLLALLTCPLLAQGLTARTAELPPEGAFVPVNLNPVVNDFKPLEFSSDHVQCQSVPFDLARTAKANCLFLKPIGWSAATNEGDAEYPSYIANYDNWVNTFKDPSRAMVRVPVGDYKAIWLLAAADNDAALSDIVTFRFGMAEGQGPVSWHAVSTRIPRANAAAPAGVSATMPTAAGNLYLIRVPFGQAIAQDYQITRTFWLDITKEIRLAVKEPDPYRYALRPLGPSSGVRIYGITLERSALQMEMTAAEPGNVFNQPQAPTFKLDLYNVLNEHWIPYTVEAVATADDGTVVRQVTPEAFRSCAWVYGNPVLHHTVTLPVPKRGLYHLKISLLAQGEVVLSRETTFAVLAPNTRKYRNESPFGTWDFAGGHVTPNDPDLRGALLVKAGLRYGLSEQPLAVRQQYGLLPGGDLAVSSAAEIKALQEQIKKDPTTPVPARFLIFHENAVSGPHITRVPDLFTGRAPYKMSADEEKFFKGKDLWGRAAETIPAIRAAFPKSEIYFGNTTPHLLEEFLRNGWPVKDLGNIGNESGSFMRLPETQPTDFVAANACMWMLRQIADHYGAKDVPLRQCLEIGYPGSGPGNLTEMTQAAYLVRHNIHSLAWRIPVIRPMTLSDMGNSYHDSNWGAAGLMHAWPDVSPKPAYVAYAVQTQVLDGATFTRYISTGSTAVYAAEFRKKDKSYVTCFWTVRGTYPLTLKVPGAKQAVLTDLMGRESTVAFTKDSGTVPVPNTPCYLATPRPIAAITRGTPVHETQPAGKSAVISSLDNLNDWTVRNAADSELDMYNFLNPRRQGNFEYKEVPAGGKSVLEVSPKLPVAGSPYLQMYSSLVLKQPAEIPGEPTQIGVVVNGNGGWGRIIFELTDASGQRWISLGAEQAGAPNPWMADWLPAAEFAKLKGSNVNDWSSDDAWGRSYINFDGWRLVKFPLPGQYPGEGYHWPMNSQWRWDKDGVVHYPLKFTRLVITMPEKVLYGTEYIAPPKYQIQLKDLMVLYEPVEKVFAGE